MKGVALQAQQEIAAFFASDGEADLAAIDPDGPCQPDATGCLFESPADARFVMGAGLDARAVFTWLSLRTVRTIALSVGLVLLFFQVVYLPWFGISGERALLFTMAAATFGMIVFGCRLVAFNVKRAMSWLPIGTLGLLLALTGVALFGATLAGATGLASLPAGLETINRALPPGRIVLGIHAMKFTSQSRIASQI